MNKLKRGVLIGTALAIGAVTLTSVGAAPVQAADQDVVLEIHFDGLLDTDGVAAAEASATTAFTKANPVQGSGYGGNTMFDEGTYIIGSNPNAYHVFWAPILDNNPKLILNGFTNAGDQNVFTVTTQGEVCTTPGSSITFSFAAKMANVFPGTTVDSGAKITVKINGEAIGSEQVLTDDPTNVVEITGSAPAAADGSLVISVVNNSTIVSGNDFSLDDIVITQVGDCAPPACVPTTEGVWFNYTGKYSGGNLIPPPLNDPKWHALPAQPGGQHDLALRGFNKPYNPGADKGKGDWFVWKNLGVVCPEA